MSYAPIAARLRAKYGAAQKTPTQTTALADDYARAEREAIRIEDGGLPDSWAVALHAIERGPRPEAISDDAWRAMLDRMQLRAAEWGAAFAANGWTFEEAFGCGDHWKRLDERGAAWFVPDGCIVEVTPDRIVFERAGKRSFHRKGELH